MEGLQSDLEVRVSMFVLAQPFLHLNGYAQLFTDLALQRNFGGFAGFDLAAGKFPQPSQQAFGRATLNEYPITAVQHRPHDLIMGDGFLFGH